MILDLRRAEALDYIKTFRGTWYTWGGDDPSSFDCSGLAIEFCKSFGGLPRGGDWTAHALAHMFNKIDPEEKEDAAGNLVFWWGSSNTRIGHVEICVGNGIALGASGGGPWVKTIEDAIASNAFVKQRPIASRGGVAWYGDPFLS